jgi:hypothetical protein
MDLLTITVTNSNDPSCQRLVLTERDEIPVTREPMGFILDKIKEVEQTFRDLFPKGMTYSIPFTTVKITRREALSLIEGHRASAKEAARA